MVALSPMLYRDYATPVPPWTPQPGPGLPAEIARSQPVPPSISCRVPSMKSNREPLNVEPAAFLSTPKLVSSDIRDFRRTHTFADKMGNQPPQLDQSETPLSHKIKRTSPLPFPHSNTYKRN